MADFDNLNEIVGVIVKDVVNEICPEPPPDYTKTICSQEPRDVFLVVDGSLSIGPTQFEKIRVFLTKLVKAVVVNPNMTHFGLLQFSSIRKTRVEFTLDYSHREATLLNRIKYLRYQEGTSTYTGNALKIVEQEVFTVEGDDRPEVDDILIVFTDGATRDQRVAVRHADRMKRETCTS
ncbi:cartilage matrix protein-like [Dendronephthya gigantea]|uniref:cartilage matrix protein-like n=1 Tax=Dendronephthya gigantea TaxID=151771 RepID=UPI00106C8F50|nr:cartilage matrix protein-like [Dendronephthya gigantea]XP_028419267.1 cartilage matrix protein-like [Dendronephthya gigantea]